MKRVLAWLAILVVIAGCGIGEALQDPGDPVDMTPSTLAGTWHGGTERFITFREDGTFSAINLPYALFKNDFDSGSHPASQKVDGTGTWALVGTAGRPDSPRSNVHLDFEQLTGASHRIASIELNALRPEDGKVYLVVFYIGDGGNSFTGYLKCASDCVLPSPGPPTAPSARPSSPRAS